HVARVGGLNEYFDAADLRAARAPVQPQLTAAYAEWRAREGNTTGPLGILFPHDGDVFEDALSSRDPRRARQQIEFRISMPRGAQVAWSLNGTPLARGSNDAYFWPVRSGNWTLSVRTGATSATARFRVIPRQPHGARGFGIAAGGLFRQS